MSDSLDWWPKPFGPGDIDGVGALKLLGKPDLHPVSMLVRETAQNTWDARIGGGGAAYELHGRTLRSSQLGALRTQVFADPGQGTPLASVIAADEVQVLEINDRGTVGLGGPTRNDLAIDGALRTDYIDFVLNVGARRDKAMGAGTYGFGKTISYIASDAHTILIWSHTYGPDGEIQSRLIASAMGDHFESGGKRYTGRQWWGRVVNGAIEPVEGVIADRVARQIFRSDFSAGETGTSIMIIAPSLANGSLHSLMQDCREAIVWHLWPKLVPDDEQHMPMHISTRLEGADLPLPDVSKHPVLSGFVAALKAVREVQDENLALSGPLTSVHEIKMLKPVVDLGHLGIHRFRASSTLEEADAADEIAPIAPPVHSVALMRHDAELVVRYLKLPQPSTEGISYAGVFRCEAAVDDHFAAAEPPAHDSWEPAGMTDPVAKQHVNVALRRIRETWRDAVLVRDVDNDATSDDGRSAGFLATELADLVPALAGTGATRGPTTRSMNHRTGVHRADGPSGRRVALEIVSHQVLPIDGRLRALVGFAVDGLNGQGATVTCHAGIGFDGGTDAENEKTVVEGFVPGIQGADFDATAAVTGTHLTLDSNAQPEWTAMVSFPAGLAVDVDLRIEAGTPT